MKLPKEKFDEIYKQVPRTCVEVLIKMDPGQYVLTKRLIEPYLGMWHIPGGTVQFREKLEDAAHRVSLEELGVHVILKRDIKIIEYIENSYHAIGIIFPCKLKNIGEKEKFRGSYQAEEIKTFDAKTYQII